MKHDGWWSFQKKQELKAAGIMRAICVSAFLFLSIHLTDPGGAVPVSRGTHFPGHFSEIAQQCERTVTRVVVSFRTPPLAYNNCGPEIRKSDNGDKAVTG